MIIAPPVHEAWHVEVRKSKNRSFNGVSNRPQFGLDAESPLLQTHTRVLNNGLDDGFGAGYPKFPRAHVTTELRALPNPDLLAGLLYW